MANMTPTMCLRSPLRALLQSSRSTVSHRAFAPIRTLHTLRNKSILPPISIQTAFPQMFPVRSAVMQARSFGGASQNMLAHVESMANNNPTSATAQNAFYTALQRANLPAIIIERYSSGRYATNASCDAIYQKAIEKLGQTVNSTSSTFLNGPTSKGLTQEQIQSLGIAIATKAGNGNIGANVTRSDATNTGTKAEPLYVVVDETWGAYILKWVKFILTYGLMIWITLMLVMMILEGGSLNKRGLGGLIGGGGPTQAQAQQQTTRFADVHGCEEAKDELQELVEFLKDPAKFSGLGGKLPKGVLLVGPPGTGKTLLARAVAGEAGVPFFFMSGSEFDEIFVGVGAKRIRDLFAAARAKAPAIIFIDELDAVGGKRRERDQAYAKQTLNQLLTEMDGFSQETGIIVMAATNFPQSLDDALMRPGRFDRHVAVPLPDVRGRIAILKHHMKKIKAESNVDATVIARGTPGFSGADLENLINQAAVRASRNKQKSVTTNDLDWARDKILMGAERRSAVIQQKDKIMTAYHEGGHALVAMFTEGSDPVYKATIMPRGMALGITMTLPAMDKVSKSKKEFLADIDKCMGGKIAEELIYGPENTTSGASNDIQQATAIAFAMVTSYGFSEVLGDVDLSSNYARLSSETKQTIESEVRRLIEESRQRTTKLLTTRRRELEIIANALVEYEVLDLKEMQQVLRGEKLNKISLGEGIPIKVPEPKFPPKVGELHKPPPAFGGASPPSSTPPPPPPSSSSPPGTPDQTSGGSGVRI